jgi:CHRD domain
MRHGTAIACVLLMVACAASHPVAQSTKTFKGRLAPVPMTTAMASTVAGSGSVTAVLTGNKVTITGTFDGLKSPATIAQIHKAQRGVRGPIILDVKVSNNANGTSGTISGTLDLTPQQVADLEKGWLYVQLHSEKAPEGNLWGWLLAPENRR